MLTDDLKRVALRLLKALDNDEARVVADHIRHNRWDSLVKIKFDPTLHQHKSVDQFRRVCLAQEFLRKAEFLDTSVDKPAVAREGFLLSEKQCKETNDRLDAFLGDNPVYTTALEDRADLILRQARAWIRRLLGPLPNRLSGRFGPGAVFESAEWRHKRSMTAYDKLRNVPCTSQNVSHALVDHLVWETAYAHAWADACPDRSFPRVRGNRFTTVPKDATKDRGIAIEPGINVLGQLAVGDELKQRLRRVGIDLRGVSDRVHPILKRLGLELGLPWKGQHLHRKMAKEASVSGSHATIDLTNASDTICLNLVKLLLPEDWYILLSELRSPMTLYSPTGRKRDRRWYRLEKFSSMGNGYTFELETTIFCALAHAVGCRIGHDTFVYGDDIIVPSHLSREMLAILRFCGLTPNAGKTFVSEIPFRESCGGDFFLGHDVRPFYIKEDPYASPSALIGFANNLRAWSLKWDMPELIAVRAAVLDSIPADIRRCRGPEELGNLCIHDDEPNWAVTWRQSKRWIRVWRPVLRKRYLFSIARRVPLKGKRFQVVRELSETGVALTAALTGLPSDGISPRNAVEGYRFGRVAYS
mgnify:CR=1 FL=1